MKSFFDVRQNYGAPNQKYRTPNQKYRTPNQKNYEKFQNILSGKTWPFFESTDMQNIAKRRKVA